MIMSLVIIMFIIIITGLETKTLPLKIQGVVR